MCSRSSLHTSNFRRSATFDLWGTPDGNAEGLHPRDGHPLRTLDAHGCRCTARLAKG